MKIKAVVKVMNFHALLRVERSRKMAERYQTMANELEKVLRIILSNNNLRLDKKIVFPDPNLPVLRIYIGSDLGFCGNVNSSVSSVLLKDHDSTKIVIGKKLPHKNEISLYLSREDYENNFSKVKTYLVDAVKKLNWSAIEIVYNHFYNISNIKQEIKRIYPLTVENDKEIKSTWDDFILESDMDDMLSEIIISCLIYQVKIASANSYASENCMRQNATTESLKKIDEIETETIREERKIHTEKSFKKTIDSYIKQKSLRRA